MKEIMLSQNKVALVDDRDYGYLNQYKWRYFKQKGNRAYALTNIYNLYGKRTTMLMHRMIEIDASKDKDIDHVDGDGCNNQRINLRICSRGENLANSVIPVDSLSGYKGVSWCKKNLKWRSVITWQKRFIHIGYYSVKEEAAQAYNEAAIKYHGKFARLNILN